MMRISFTKAVACIALSIMLSSGSAFAQSSTQKKISGQIAGWSTSFKLYSDSAELAKMQENFVSEFNRLKPQSNREFFVKQFTKVFGPMLENKDSAFNKGDTLRANRRLILMVTVSQLRSKASAKYLLKFANDKKASIKMLAWKGIDHSRKFVFKLGKKSRAKFLKAFDNCITSDQNPFVLEAAYSFANISAKNAKAMKIKSSSQKSIAKNLIKSICNSRANACKVLKATKCATVAQAMQTAVSALNNLSTLVALPQKLKTETVQFTFDVAITASNILGNNAIPWKEKDVNNLKIPAYISLIVKAEQFIFFQVELKGEKKNSDLAKKYKGNKDDDIEFIEFSLNLQEILNDKKIINLGIKEPK